MHQQSLPFRLDEKSLRALLERLSGKSLSVIITDNTTSMLSMKNHGTSVSMRIHRMFLTAGTEVLEEMAGYIKNSRARTPHIRSYINQNTHSLKKRPPRKMNMKTAGSVYDLLLIFHSVNSEYFNGKIRASITWGSRRPRRAAARRTLGSYCVDNNLIRISPVLDSRSVPRYFVEFIVYHEMLHADIGIVMKKERCSIHPREFQRRERLFKYYDRAIAWEKKRW